MAGPAQMEVRELGRSGLRVSAIGYGCFGISAYGSHDEGEVERTVRRAVDAGITMFDTADSYGPHTNEVLIGRMLGGVRDDVTLATKFGQVKGPAGSRQVDGSPEYVRSACDASLARLGTDRIDLYYLHRVDPTVPIEETVGAMAGLVAAGKVRHLGLSEVGAETLRRAHAVHPITAVQSEYSLWTRDVERSTLAVMRELGVGLVAYSPLGRGFLTGTISDAAALEDGDLRRNNPRFAPENLASNQALIGSVRAIADRLGATPSQVALAWVLSRGEDVVPIPGTTKVANLETNLGALRIGLSQDDVAELEALLDRHEVAGERYQPMLLGLIDDRTSAADDPQGTGATT
jgi:aryl-alcohol dehydrogenase-like predicted oxidoreductase